MIHISSHYIDLVHKTIAVDRKFYLAYRYLYENCDQNCPKEQFDKDKYEDVFAQYAKEQLDWVVSQELVTVDTTQSSSPNAGVLPRWSSDAWLELVQIVTADVAEDLQTSPWADDYQCLIEKLLTTRNAIRDRSWGDTRDTSNIVYPRIKKYAQILADHNHECVQVPK